MIPEVGELDLSAPMAAHEAENTRQSGHKLGVPVFATLALATVVLAGLVAFVDMPRGTMGLIVIAMTVTTMMLGVHIGVSMALPSLLGAYKLGGMPAIAYALEELPKSSAASWTLSVVPLFILMGLVVFRSGLATVLFDAARQLVGHLPGGLAVGTIFAGAGMSAASGSTLGVTYATARMAVPEMLRSGYAPRMALGTVTMAGVLKMLIPPSVTVVIYAGIAETPMGPQLLAGIVPGGVLAVMFAVLIMARAKLHPEIAPRTDLSGVTWSTRLRALAQAWPVALLALIIVGGVYSGLTTPTESGALAAFAATLIGAWVSRHEGPKAFLVGFGQAVGQTVAATAAVMLMLISVNILTTFVALTGLLQTSTQFIVDLGLSRTTFLLILIVMYVIMGMFMDELAMMLLTVPILLPTLAAYNVDLIWFGVFLILLCEVGMVVPPVGMLSFVVHGIAQDREVNLGREISLVDVFAGVLPFVIIALVLIVGLIFVPGLATWLPNLSNP